VAVVSAADTVGFAGEPAIVSAKHRESRPAATAPAMRRRSATASYGTCGAGGHCRAPAASQESCSSGMATSSSPPKIPRFFRKCVIC
jgi:hypothetical protein